MASFNLLTEDWIPVLPKRGTHSFNVGICQLLAESDQLLGVQAPTPLETIAIYRLLLAVLHNQFDVTEEWWIKVWQERRFHYQEIEDYLNIHLTQFDLFDDKRPFFQDVMLNRKPETVSSLQGHLASGADATLFDHTNASTPLTMTPAEAARALLSIQAFGVGGTKGKDAQFTDAPCARGVLFLIEGATLFETLMLNLFDREELTSFRLKDKSKDCPAWELDDPFTVNPQRPYGLLDHLTWHNRRVKLIPEEDSTGTVVVRSIMYAPGLPSFDGEKKTVREVFNPFYHWRANKEGKSRSHSPISFQPDRALWRDSHTLLRIFSKQSEMQDKSPYALTWLRGFVPANLLTTHQTYKRSAFGASTEIGRDKTFFYRSEAMSLPLALLQANDIHIAHVGIALDLAERVSKQIKSSTFNLARVTLYPNVKEEELDETQTAAMIVKGLKKGKDEAAKQAERVNRLHNSWGIERYYWSELEFHFHCLIQALPSNPELALSEWRKQIWFAAYNAFDRASSYVSDEHRSLRASALARQQFERGINKLLPKPKSVETTEGMNAEGDEE